MTIKNLSIKNQLIIIQGKIRTLPLSKNFKATLMEDINLAFISLGQNNLSGALDSLSVIVGKISLCMIVKNEEATLPIC